MSSMKDMLLLGEKYRPLTLGELDTSVDDLSSLTLICNAIIYGKAGCGKMTVALCWLHQIFGDSIRQQRKTSFECKAGGKTIEVHISYSSHHFIINPSLYGVHDRHVLQQFVKDTTATSNVSTYGFDKHRYKVIIVRDADHLSEGAQNALRHTMEQHMDDCRFIFLAKSLNRFTDAIISRTLNVAVKSDSSSVKNCLSRITRQEHVDIPDVEITRIVQNSRGNIRLALHDLERYRVGLGPQHDALIDSLEKIKICMSQELLRSGEAYPNMIKVREVMYNALISGIRPGFLLRTLLGVILSTTENEDAKRKLIRKACEQSITLTQVNKPLLALEAFICTTYLVLQDSQSP